MTKAGGGLKAVVPDSRIDVGRRVLTVKNMSPSPAPFSPTRATEGANHEAYRSVHAADTR